MRARAAVPKSLGVEIRVSTTAVPTKHEKLLAWVEEVAQLTQPDEIHWCDGSAE